MLLWGVGGLRGGQGSYHLCDCGLEVLIVLERWEGGEMLEVGAVVTLFTLGYLGKGPRCGCGLVR